METKNTTGINYTPLPERLRAGMKGYVEHHRRTGSFLRAVLENNLSASFARADVDSLPQLHEIVRFVYNEIPARVWGSPEVVEAWLAGDDDSSAGR